jgi:arylformamidase
LTAAQHERVKGPLVFLDYDQAELDAAYDQAVYAPNRELINERNIANAARARKRLGEPLRFQYGPTPVEHLDVFRTTVPNAPVFVFIHGGAWKKTSMSRYGYIAEPLVAAGAHCALVQFNGVEEVGGSLMPMAHQVRSAVAWVYKNAAQFGGDPKRIYVGGHSSGAHLTGVVTITNWSEYGVPDDILQGALCCSGMYELAPVRLSKRSTYVKFDDAMVEALSTIRHLDRIRIPLVVGYGTYETPEFQRQNREFAAALEAAGKPVRLVVGEGFNHFEIIETLGNPYGLIGHAVFELMHLTPGAANG